MGPARSPPSAWANQPGARWVADLDSTPDDAVVAPGHIFNKVWRVRNTGATSWDEGYRLVHVDGPALGALSSLAVAPACAPGQTADIQAGFVTPGAEGQYTSVWSLADAQGRRFGEVLYTRPTGCACGQRPAAPTRSRRSRRPATKL
jgi:hypothetical protein